MVSVLNKIYEYIDVSTIFDVGPLFILCISFPVFVSLSLILFLLSYVKEPILEFAPSFSSLRGFVLSKSGCELHVLKVYVIFIYLPFVIVFGLMVNQHVPFLAVFVYFIYQTIILFRRIRLLNRFLNKIYDLCSSELGMKEYVRKDCHRFLTAVISLQIFPLSQGLFFLPKPRRGSELRVLFENLHNDFLSILFASKEFRSLNISKQQELVNLVNFKFNGIIGHVCVGFEVTAYSAFVAFALTKDGNPPLIREQQQEFCLTLGRELTEHAPELAAIFAPWRKGGIGLSQQYLVKDPTIFDLGATGISLRKAENLPLNINEGFVTEANVNSVYKSVRSFKEFLSAGLPEESRYGLTGPGHAVRSFNSARDDAKMFLVDGSQNAVEAFISDNS